MSALDRAWRQGRLDPFKGCDMPLEKKANGGLKQGGPHPTGRIRMGA